MKDVILETYESYLSATDLHRSEELTSAILTLADVVADAANRIVREMMRRK